MIKKLNKNDNLIIFHNADKSFQENNNLDNLADLAHSFCVLMASNPSCGKTNLIKNILVNQNKPFQKIIIVHYDTNTNEYKDINVELRNNIPELDEIDKSIKNIIILEDIDYKSLNKNDKSRLNRLLGYDRSHKNCSVILTSQTVIDIPTNLRRMATHFVVWNSIDKISLRSLCGFSNTSDGFIRKILNTHCTHPCDSLIIDNNKSTPKLPKYRINLFNVVNIDEF